MTALAPPTAVRAVAVRVGAVVVVGLATGCATSVLQKYLGEPWHSLVNAASPWLVAAFVVGVLQANLRDGAAAGIAVTLLELVGYYGTSHLRGYAVSHSILVFWAVCAIVGGPIFGAAGWAWRHRGSRFSNLGGAVLPAAFIGEGLVTYAWFLGYTSSAVLFVALGAVLFLAVAFRPPRYLGVASWLILTVPLAIAGELLLHLVYQQSF